MEIEVRFVAPNDDGIGDTETWTTSDLSILPSKDDIVVIDNIEYVVVRRKYRYYHFSQVSTVDVYCVPCK